MTVSPDAIRAVQSSTLDETVYRTTLPSGLTVCFCPKPGFQKKYACYSTFYGSLDNDFEVDGQRLRVPDGIAHFLEHSLFETESGNVSDLFAINGAYDNAATSFTTTAYLFATSDRFYDNLELLLGFVENPAFRAEKVEKERGIIEQEIRGYDDSADWVSYRTLLEALFREHPIRIDIAGTPETIADVDVGLLDRCYRAFYHPKNMCLFVVGDLERDRLFDFVADTSKPTAIGAAVGERYFPREDRGVHEARREIEMEVAIPKLFLGFKEIGVPATGREYMLREFESEIALEILFGRSSDLFRELYESGLVLDDFSASYGAAAGIGYAMIGGDSPKPLELEATLRDRLGRLAHDGLSEEDFEREKRRFIGGFVRSFNSLEYIAKSYTYFHFYDFDLFDSIDLLHEISKEGLDARLRALLDVDCLSTVLVKPLRS